nr:MFS transporter [Planococcus glaciei]
MITRRTVLFLGLSQLICWGISYYLIAAFGEVIADELGWSGTLVYGGFSAALIVMGLTSPLTGKLIDKYSGRFVMSAGSLLLAIGCAGIALSQSVLAYYISWIVLGFAMRLSLYDAAFATLVRIAGSDAKRSISQITLLGGLASTVFWPIGFFPFCIFRLAGGFAGLYRVCTADASAASRHSKRTVQRKQNGRRPKIRCF